MSTLEQLSHAAAVALRDAERANADVASHFLRVQLPELFRLARHVPPARPTTDFHPHDSVDPKAETDLIPKGFTDVR